MLYNSIFRDSSVYDRPNLKSDVWGRKVHIKTGCVKHDTHTFCSQVTHPNHPAGCLGFGLGAKNSPMHSLQHVVN